MDAIASPPLNRHIRQGAQDLQRALAWLTEHGCCARGASLGEGRPRIEIDPPPLDARDHFASTLLRIERGPAGRRELVAAPLFDCVVLWDARGPLPPCVGAALRDGTAERLRALGAAP